MDLWGGEGCVVRASTTGQRRIARQKPDLARPSATHVVCGGCGMYGDCRVVSRVLLWRPSVSCFADWPPVVSVSRLPPALGCRLPGGSSGDPGFPRPQPGHVGPRNQPPGLLCPFPPFPGPTCRPSGVRAHAAARSSFATHRLPGQSRSLLAS